MTSEFCVTWDEEKRHEYRKPFAKQHGMWFQKRVTYDNKNVK